MAGLDRRGWRYGAAFALGVLVGGGLGALVATAVATGVDTASVVAPVLGYRSDEQAASDELERARLATRIAELEARARVAVAERDARGDSAVDGEAHDARSWNAARWLAEIRPDLTAAEVDPNGRFDLDLRDRDVDDADAAHLAAFENLRRLGLRGVPITDLALPHLGGLANLRELDLRGTAVSGEMLGALPSGLVALDLTATAVESARLAALADRGLERLCLNSTRIDGNAVEWLLRLPRLRHVELDGTAFTAEDLARLLHGARQLERVEVRATAIDPADLADLRTAFPDVAVVSD